MTPRIGLPAAWVLAALFGLTALVGWVRAIPSIESGAVVQAGTVRSWQTADSAELERMAGELRLHDPFRWSHHRSPVTYDPDAPTQNVAPPPRPAAPVLTLSGIVGGPPWVVMIEGIPGREGSTLLAVGKTVNGIRLTMVRRDTAFLTGLDTNWALTTRRMIR